MKMKVFNIYSYFLLITILPVAGWFLYIIVKYPDEGKNGIWFFLLILLFYILSCKKIARKITEKNRELEESNRHLNEIDRLKTEFLANVSHELRTPLTVIMGYSELLLEQYDKKLERNTQRKFLKTIYQKSEDLLSLINDLIELSRIESGRLEMNVETLNLEGILYETTDDFSQEAVKRKQSLKTDIKGIPLLIKGDRGKVKQIIRNLIENAIKYSPEEGKIIVRGYVSNERVFVEVEDDGMGIARENFDQIYQPFKQINGMYNKKSEGFGLGLTITKNLLKYHNGTIELHSIPGEGCKFIISFPSHKQGDE